MRLTEKLAALRKKNCLTQSALAEKMDLSRQAVSRWESGETAPSMDNLRRLSSLYDVPLDCLLNDDAELPGPETAVAVMERPELKNTAKGNGQKFILISVIAVFALLAFFVGHIMGKNSNKDLAPTYPVHTDIWNEYDVEGPFNVSPLSSPPACTDVLDGGNFEGTFDIIEQ